MKRKLIIVFLTLILLLSSFVFAFADPLPVYSAPLPVKVSQAIDQIKSEGQEVIVYKYSNFNEPDNINKYFYYVRGFKTTGNYSGYIMDYPYIYVTASEKGIKNYQYDGFQFFSNASYSAETDNLNSSYNITVPSNASLQSHNADGSVYNGFAIVYCSTPIFDQTYVPQSHTGSSVYSYVNPVITKSISPSQRILFDYTDTNKSLFLKSLTVTPGKGITLHQAYYLNGQINNITIQKDTTDLPFQIAPHAVTLSDFPIPRNLNNNELLGFSQANGGNIPIGNNPISTDTNAIVSITFDSTKCSYSILSANTGLTITSGGIAGGVSTGGIYNNSDAVTGSISDDYMLDRADYEDGILGSIEYGFDTLFQFMKMPFEILAKFILALGEIVTYSIGAVGGLMGALTGVYGVLPSTISYLFVFAITIQVFKLIFGR